MTQNNNIGFHAITFIGERHTMYNCDVCNSLVAPEKLGSHIDWHDALNQKFALLAKAAL